MAQRSLVGARDRRRTVRRPDASVRWVTASAGAAVRARETQPRAPTREAGLPDGRRVEEPRAGAPGQVDGECPQNAWPRLK